MDEGPRADGLLRFLRDRVGVGPGSRCLDVGCGVGAAIPSLVEVSRPGGRVVGVDLDPDALARAEASLWALRGASFCQADARLLPFAAATFDVVYASLLLLWVVEPLQALEEIRRVTRSGGCIAVVDVDLSTMRFEPEPPSWTQFAQSLARYQKHRGLDGQVGRRLFSLFHRVDLAEVDVQASLAVVTPSMAHWADAVGLATGTLSDELVLSGALDSGDLAALRDDVERLGGDGSSLFIPGTTYAVCGRVADARAGAAGCA